MIKDSLFHNEIFENPGGQNYPANGAIMAACAINLTKGIEKPNMMLGFLFFA